MDGLLLVDKPAGCTSHDVVQRARRALSERKIGHCGTLDPSATGLLLLTLGRATRLTRFLISAPKVYEGVLRFGIETDTYDGEGQIVAERAIGELQLDDVRAAMEAFEGTYEQQAPPFSAKKHRGKKYYELARAGKKVPKQTSEVEVFQFEPLATEIVDDQLSFRLACASGTYARSLAHDLGRRLGCGAHLAGLRRTAIGHFPIDDAITLADLEAGADEPLERGWIPFDEIPLPFAEAVVDSAQERRLLNGQAVVHSDHGAAEGDWVKLLDRRRRFIAVAVVAESIGSTGTAKLQPRIVFG